MKKLITTIIVTIALSSCCAGHNYRAIDVFSYQFKCDEENVEIVSSEFEFGGACYMEVEGCGYKTRYRCASSSGCVEQ